MPLGIYKPGQGYWVRTLSAVGAGLLVLAGAAWAWGQAGAVRLPVASHTVSVRAASGEIHPGDVVTYLRPGDDNQGTPTEFGNGVARETAVGQDRSGIVVIGDFSNEDVRDKFGQTIRLSTEGGFSAQVANVSPTPIFSQQYLQAGCAGVVLLLGFIVIYWFTGTGRKTNEFLIATDGEMKKVNWSTPKEIRGSTIVVIVAAFLIAAILFGIDTLFAWFFRTIHVLQA